MQIKMTRNVMTSQGPKNKEELLNVDKNEALDLIAINAAVEYREDKAPALAMNNGLSRDMDAVKDKKKGR